MTDLDPKYREKMFHVEHRDKKSSTWNVMPAKSIPLLASRLYVFALGPVYGLRR